MTGILVRALIAVIALVILFALLPLLISFTGVPIDGAALGIIKLCLGGLALIYVFWGPAPPWPAARP